MVSKNFNIQISNSALSSLLTSKRVGGEKPMAKCFEQILKTLLQMLNFQNICSLAVLQLVLLWNFPGMKITGNFSATCFSYFHTISLLGVHTSVEVVLLLH